MASTTTVTGRLLDGNGNARESEYVYFRLLSVGTDVGADDGVSPEETFPRGTVEAKSDASGDFSVTLWVNGDSDVDSVYEVRFEDGQTVDVIIPTSASGGTIDLATLISTHQPTGSSTQQSSVYDQARDRTNHTGGPDDLNGEAIIFDVDGDTKVQATSDDTLVWTFGGVDELTLTAAKADNLDDLAAFTPSDEAVIRGNGTDWVVATNFRVDAGTNNSGTEMGTGVADGAMAVAEGDLTTASGSQSHAEGFLTTASGSQSHAEGLGTTASGASSHAEGASTTASGDYSAATGRRGKAIHDGARVEADSQNADVSSTTTDQYTARFQNGYEFKGGDATFEADVTAVDGTFSGNFKVTGGITTSTSLVTATTYTVLTTDYIVLVDDDTAGAAVTVTLPAAATAADGFTVIIFKKGSTATVTIDGDGSETINGAATQTLTAQYESIKLITDGSEWFIIEA